MDSPSTNFPLIPPSIRDRHFVALDAVASRLQQLQHDRILDVYNIDTVAVSALPHLAQQLNVYGLRGWFLADTEAEQRALVKVAIELNRRAGTPFAIRRALTALGFESIQIDENPPLLYNGLAMNYRGDDFYDGIMAGAFEVRLTSPKQLSQARIDLIVALINEWKNARSQLIELYINGLPVFRDLLLYNGLWSYNGAQTYDGLRLG